MTFKVIDKKTGKEADTYKIALKEDWAKHLMYCDMEGFAIEEDGSLVLMDECGNVAYCPADRFEIVFEEEEPQGEYIRKEDVIALLNKWADGYSYIEIPTEDAIKAIKEMKCGAK